MKAHLKAINDTHTSSIITIEHNIAALTNASNIHRVRASNTQCIEINSN